MTIELQGDTDKIPTYVKEAKKNNIKVLPPDVNESTDEFVVIGDTVRYPLSAVMNVGNVAVKEIIKNKPYRNLKDFVSRVPNKVNKRIIKNLIKVGAFDSIDNKNRNILLESFTGEKYITWSKDIASQYESEMIGISLTSHPLDGMNIIPFSTFPDGNAYVTGIISYVKKIKDRKGNDMCFLKVENQFEEVEVTVFSYQFSRYTNLFIEGVKVRISGKKENDKMILNSIEVI